MGKAPAGPNPVYLAVVARKFAPNGSELPYGPDGQGLTLPGEAPNINAFGPRYTGAALAPSGDIYVSTVTLKGMSINAFGPDGGRLSRVASDGRITVLADWPAGSSNAVAPTSVTLGPDGSLLFVDLLSGHLMKRTSAGMVVSLGDVQAKHGFFFGQSRYAWIAVESADRAYVINGVPFPNGFLLRRVEGGAVTVVAGNASGGGVDGTGTAASFGSPAGLSIGSGGVIYVADGTRLRKVTSAGVVTTVAGQADSNLLTTGPLPGSLGTLRAMAVGPDEAIHVMTQPPGGGALVKIKLQ